MLVQKALSVRVPEERIRKLMRLRRAKSRSALINALLAEEEERLQSHRVLGKTAGLARAGDLDDRLL
jgi:hypothetical protein